MSSDVYNPTPEEIKADCEEIKDGWDDATRNQRMTTYTRKTYKVQRGRTHLFQHEHEGSINEPP